MVNGENQLQNLPSPTILKPMISNTGTPAQSPSAAASPANVILSVHVATADRRTMNELRNWIQNRPHVAHRIQVDNVYHSTSVIVIMVVTFDIWYGLQGHPAIHFIGFQINDNYGAHLPRQNTNQNQKENIPKTSQDNKIAGGSFNTGGALSEKRIN
jgi:hypothetical protein